MGGRRNGPEAAPGVGHADRKRTSKKRTETMRKRPPTRAAATAAPLSLAAAFDMAGGRVIAGFRVTSGLWITRPSGVVGLWITRPRGSFWGDFWERVLATPRLG